MQTQTALQIIEMPRGKDAIERLERTYVDLILSGDVDPLEVEVSLKGIEEAIKAIRNNAAVRHAVLAEAGMFPEKTFEKYGAQITKKLTPARYDYESCEDPTWNELNKKVATLTDQRKQREKLLQTLTSPMSINDQDTGEVVMIYPPQKEQGETIAIKFV
jgi:hypothetical protein